MRDHPSTARPGAVDHTVPMRLRLHSRSINSAGQRVRIVLNLKGLAYEYVPVASPGTADYGAINPQQLLPTLEIDGRHIPQSMAIIELLEELFPRPSVLPLDPLLRAEVRGFSHHISSEVHPITIHRIRDHLADVVGVADDKISDWYKHWVAKAFTSLEQQLARRSRTTRYCFTDDAPSLADACLVPQMDNARRFGCDVSPYPLLVAADAEARRLDAFQRAAPERQVDFTRK